MAEMKGLLFDFDNTLVTTTKSDLRALQIVKERLLKDFSKENVELIANAYLELLAKGSIDLERLVDPHQWRTTLWQKSIDVVPQQGEKPIAKDIYNLWRFARLEGISLDQEIAALLQKLRLKFKLAIVTNSDPVIQKEKLQSCGIIDYFDAIIISGEQPHPKPHPSIFHKACADIGVPPEQCIMIGDSPEHDIQGGINAGVLATVWVRNESRDLMSRDLKPDFTIATVLELPKILDQLLSQAHSD